MSTRSIFGLAVADRLFYPVYHDQGERMTDQRGTPVVATAQIAGARDGAD
jgi:hypothetical protein